MGKGLSRQGSQRNHVHLRTGRRSRLLRHRPATAILWLRSLQKGLPGFFDQFQGPVEIEYRDLKIVAGDTVAFSRGLERMTGTLKNGQNLTPGYVLPSATARPTADG